MKKIRVGLIGFSVAGQVFHAPIIIGIEGLELYKVTARREEQRKILNEKYPDALAVASVEEIIEDPKVDLVVVATSNDVHYELTKKALLAGKHVVVEKPFTNTTVEADELIALAKDRNLMLSVHHNARWLADFKTVKKVINEGRLGRLVSYEARYDRFRNYLRPNAWREEDLPGSGIHYDLGAHLIDQALQLFGRPQAVFADLRKQREGAKAIDDFEIILYYDKLKVSLKGQMLAKEPTARYALFGWNGSFTKYGVDPQEALLRDGVFPHEYPDWGVENEQNYGKLNVLANGKDVEEYVASEVGDTPSYYKNITGVLLYEEELIVKPEQARDVICILEMSELSDQEGRKIDLQDKLIS